MRQAEDERSEKGEEGDGAQEKCKHHGGVAHQPHKVAAATVDGLGAQVNVAGEAVLHQAVLGRL